MTLSVEPTSSSPAQSVKSARSHASPKLHPVTPVIGAEVTGVDLREELDASTVSSLRKALLEHKVLFFRDQAITDEQQVRFTRYFAR